MGFLDRRMIVAGIAAGTLAGCGSAPSAVVAPTGPYAAALGPVETASPSVLPGYGFAGPGHPTPNPMACATSAAVPSHATATVTVGAAAPAGATELRVGDTLLVTALEACDFSWHLGSVTATNPSVLNVIGGSVLPDGAQGRAWMQYRAAAVGTVRLIVSGACAIPDPFPVEPSGVSLACDTVGHAFLVNVDVSP